MNERNKLIVFKSNSFKISENKLNSIFKRNKKGKQIKNIILYLFVFLFIIIFCFIIYMKKRKLYLDNDSILKPYIKSQNDFCENQNKYLNEKYEKDIFLADIQINNLKYQAYIYKSGFMVGQYKRTGAFEVTISNKMIEALKFYGTKNNILNNKEILMLDIGGNTGWYPTLLSRYGYSILTFEVSEKNYYVLKKNYCLLNEDSNVVIITKGLGNEEKKCHYFIAKTNKDNGMVICDKDNIEENSLGNTFGKYSDVEITTLNSFKPYLSNKNIALMKIDTEGHELKILQGGSDLITKYHVPFIVLEFSPKMLREVGSDPKELALFLTSNGYKISIKGLLSKEYITINELLFKARNQINCYFIHETIDEIIP